MWFIILFDLSCEGVAKTLYNIIFKFLQFFNSLINREHFIFRIIIFNFPTNFWVIFVYQMKRCRVNENMLIIYISELYNKQLFYLINLFIVDEHSQKMF